MALRQPWYQYSGSSWEPPASQSSDVHTPPGIGTSLSLRLITWNVDVLWPGTDLRMESAISYLESLLAKPQDTGPSVIFLQEMCLSDLDLLQKASWVRNGFFITDIDNSHWADKRYGTTTLIDRLLEISDVFRVRYKSNYGRDGLFVDLNLSGDSSNTKVLRLCNTHLESLISDPPLRPGQLSIASQHLHDKEVQAGVLAGDLNAIQDFDKILHEQSNLHDAFLWLGGQEGRDEGYTWGYQCEDYLMKRFGPSRMDKVLFCGGVSVSGLERVGIGAKVKDAKRDEMRRLNNGLDWITDHYGLAVTLSILA